MFCGQNLLQALVDAFFNFTGFGVVCLTLTGEIGNHSGGTGNAATCNTNAVDLLILVILVGKLGNKVVPFRQIVRVQENRHDMLVSVGTFVLESFDVAGQDPLGGIGLSAVIETGCRDTQDDCFVFALHEV